MEHTGRHRREAKRKKMKEQPTNSSWWNRHGSSWLNTLLGIWVLLSPFVLQLKSPKAIWGNLIAGALVAGLSLVRWSLDQTGWSWLTLIVAIWLVISPFVFVLSGAALLNNVIAGIVVAALALTNTYSRGPVEIEGTRG
jgi:hypothetical protein